MAITQGLSGTGGTLVGVGENDLWVRSTSGLNPKEWKVSASGGTIIFRFYYDDTNFILVPVGDGGAETLASTINNFFTRVTAQGVGLTPTWFPTIVGA